jgi:phage tail-like protein
MAGGRKAAAAGGRNSRRDEGHTPKLSPPYSSAHFRVLIGATEIGFCHITRLQASDGGASPGGASDATPPPSVILRRAITQSKDLYRWRERAAAGKRERRTVTIHQCDPTGKTILNTWVLHGCRPVRWSGPEFNALASDILWEEVEICCERLEWR